jgi:hypothetical protein
MRNPVISPTYPTGDWATANENEVGQLFLFFVIIY